MKFIQKILKNSHIALFSWSLITLLTIGIGLVIGINNQWDVTNYNTTSFNVGVIICTSVEGLILIITIISSLLYLINKSKKPLYWKTNMSRIEKAQLTNNIFLYIWSIIATLSINIIFIDRINTLWIVDYPYKFRLFFLAFYVGASGLLFLNIIMAIFNFAQKSIKLKILSNLKKSENKQISLLKIKNILQKLFWIFFIISFLFFIFIIVWLLTIFVFIVGFLDAAVMITIFTILYIIHAIILFAVAILLIRHFTKKRSKKEKKLTL